MTENNTMPAPAPYLCESSVALAGLDDEALTRWLDKRKKSKSGVVLVHAGTTCKVYDKDDTRGIVHPVDPESKAKAVFKALAKQNLLFAVEVSSSAIETINMVDTSWQVENMPVGAVEILLEQRKIHLGRVDGRGEPISNPTANRVWADAGGCCMFKGCGQDLSVVPLYNKGARIAYLAHIIASDPAGPRGTDQDSHKLSNEPENIMLMCDAHHRLIDSFAPETFKAPRLQQMRREHAEKFRIYRGAMKFAEAQVMTIFADLGGISTHYPDSEYMEVLLAEEFSMYSEVKRHLTYKNRDDRTSHDFWGNYLRELELSIRMMVQDLGQRGEPSKNVLAVFPLHHSPTLVLAGRIVGEARQVRVFQRSRQRQSWQWNSNAPKNPLGTFKLSGLADVQAKEVLLTVELTANIDEGALPTSLTSAVASGQIPWVRLTTDAPNGECIQRKDDLAQVVDAARIAINFIQDEMLAKRVHLIVVCPASVTFSLGQLMQVGHHAEFTLYDRPSGQQLFSEAFTINGHSIVPPAGSSYPSISIR